MWATGGSWGELKSKTPLLAHRTREKWGTRRVHSRHGSSSLRVQESSAPPPSAPGRPKPARGLAFGAKRDLAAGRLHPCVCNECALFCTSIFSLRSGRDQPACGQKLLTPYQSFTYWHLLGRLRRENAGVGFGGRSASSVCNERGRTIV